MTIRPAQMRRKLRPYGFLLPAMTVLAVVILYPILGNVVMSLQRMHLLEGGGGEFIGLANYAKLLSSRIFLASIGSTVRFTFISLPLAFVLGLGLALIFNEIRWGRPVFTALLIVPWAITPVVTGYMWRWLFHDSYGLVNHFLKGLGLIDANIVWLGHTDTAMAAAIVANIWRFMPYITIMLLAGLQGISAELYEAADMDGAGLLQRFWHVTLPQLRHVIGVVFLFATIWMVNDFALIYILTEGGPARGTQVLPITIYRIAFDNLLMGRGAAAGLLLLVFLLGMSFVFIRTVFRKESDEA